MTIVWITLVVLIPLAANPLSRWQFEPDKAALLMALAGLAAGGGVARVRRRLAQPLALYTTLALLATLASIDPAVSLFGAPGWRWGLLAWVACVGVFLAAAGQLRTAAARRRVVTALLLGSAPVCAYGLLQRANLDPMPWSAEVGPRVFATFGHANFFAAYLAMVAPLTLARAWAAGSRRARAGWGLLLAAQAACVALTLSRSGWLSTGVSAGVVLLALLWQAGRRRLVKGLVAGAVVTALGLLALSAMPALPGYESPFMQTVTSMFRWNSPTVQIRVIGWEAAAGMVADRPLLGYGPGAFGLALDRYYPPRLAAFGGARTLGGRPHNLLLEVAAAVGLPGAAAYVWLVGAALWGLWRHAHTRPPGAGDAAQAERLAMFAAAVGGLAAGLIEFETVSAAMLFWLLAGMAHADDTRPVRVPAPARLAIGAAGVVCAALILAPDLAGGLATHASSPARALELARQAYTWSVTPGRYGLDLGNHAAEAGAWDKGAATLTGLAERSATPAVYWRALGAFQVRRAYAEPDAKAAAFAGAAEAYSNAIDAAPADPDLWIDRGLARLELDDLEAARADFAQAAALAPDYARAVQAMGEYYMAAGQPQAAETAFARAAELREKWGLYLWQR